MTTPNHPAQTTSLAGYWDRYGTHQTSEEAPEDALKNAFGWCQYSGHGPGDELLGEPTTTLELGCGRGNAVAALATKGITATGIDLSPVQHDHATTQWGHLPGTEFVLADATEYLTNAAGRTWDAIYSIWGALWFTDPQRLLPLIRTRLQPGGRLAFSHAPPVPGSYGPQGMYAAGFTGPRLWLYHWAYEPDTWTDILTHHGFTHINAHIHPAPRPDQLGTLTITAHTNPQ